MANIIEFRKSLTQADMSPGGVAPLDGSTNFAIPLQLPVGAQPKLQVCAITISDRIPNIFDANPYYNFNNTLLKAQIRDNLGNVIVNPPPIQLPRGLYSTVDEIADAINAAIVALGWYANATLPAFVMTANVITDVVTVTMLPYKLIPAWSPPLNNYILHLDLLKTTTGTDLAETLGFGIANSVWETSAAGAINTYNSNLEVKLDSQGTACDIQSSLITLRRRNDTQVRTLAIVPFAGKNTLSDNVWPSSGQISPVLVYEGSKTIIYASFNVRTMNNRTMLFMSGAMHIVISFIY